MKIFWIVLELKSGHGFHRKNFKGDNSIKNIPGVTVLILCTLPDSGLYSYIVSQKYS